MHWYLRGLGRICVILEAFMVLAFTMQRATPTADAPYVPYDPLCLQWCEEFICAAVLQIPQGDPGRPQQGYLLPIGGINGELNTTLPDIHTADLYTS
jgi:hypothetical protein